MHRSNLSNCNKYQSNLRILVKVNQLTGFYLIGTLLSTLRRQKFFHIDNRLNGKGGCKLPYVYLELTRTSTVDLLCENSFRKQFSQKSFIVDVRLDSKNASDNSYFYNFYIISELQTWSKDSH